MTAFIDTADLATYLRDSNLDAASSALYVDLANGLVTEVTGELTTPYPASVRAIALEVAARAYRNPEGATQETIDDYTYRRAEGTGGAGVYLTGDERARLAGITGGKRAVGSVRLMSPFDDPDTTTSTLPTP